MAEISIPGNPGGLQSLAAQLRTAAGDIASVQSRVASNGLHGSWSGHASEVFRSTLHELPGELGPIVTSFEDSAQALTTFAARLSGLQEQARWCEQQMGRAQQELRAANARHAAAQTKLNAARLAHAAAADPVSLHTAQSAVSLGEGLMRQAGADIEDIGGGIAQLGARAQGVLNRYEDAVRACCSSLDASRHSGGRSLGGWVHSHVGGLLGHVDRTAVAWWRSGERTVRDAEHVGAQALREFDRAWAPLRAGLTLTSEALSDATLYVCGGGLVVAGGLALFLGPGDAAAGILVAADLEVMADAEEILQVESVVVLAGDSIASIEQPEYRANLPADAFNALPGERLFGPLERKGLREIKSQPIGRAAIKELSAADKSAEGLVKQEGKGVLRLGEDVVKDKITKAIDRAAHTIKPLISAPLEQPLLFKLGASGASMR
jgi:uncharacterized protein YukE